MTVRALLSCGVGLLVATQASGHETDPLWASAQTGLYVDVGGPVQVRGDGRAWVDVRILNLTDDHFVLVSSHLKHDGQRVHNDSRRADLAPVDHHVLAWRRADALQETLAESGPAHHALAHRLNASLFATRSSVERTSVHRRFYPGDDLSGRWTIELVIEDHHGVGRIEYPVRFERFPPLPDGSAQAIQLEMKMIEGTWSVAAATTMVGGTSMWKAGDQHIHTAFSIDAWVLEGTDEQPAEFADAARAIGLDWISISDHSNVHGSWFGTEFYTSAQHAQGTAQATAYRESEDWPLLYGQEMGLGQIGFWDLPSHMLAIPLDTFAQPFIENPSDGLLYDLANCEAEQVIIDRINASGSYGFISHPYLEEILSVAQWNWNNGTTGWAGMEIWSSRSSAFKQEDLDTLLKWHTLLGAIEPPSGGHLQARPGWPNGAPVGLGNSDAHATEELAGVFTYARLDAINPATLSDALLHGRCVASDGPLVTIELNGTGLGDVAILPGGHGRAVVRLETTSEFGTVDQYVFQLERNGQPLMALPTGSANGYAVEFVIDSDDLFAEGGYLTAWAQRDDLERLGMTNPLWLQIAVPGDVDGSGSIDVVDLLLMLSNWGDCEGCPSDANGDGVVDVDDVLIALGGFNG
jgi:hypothetical protein